MPERQHLALRKDAIDGLKLLKRPADSILLLLLDILLCIFAVLFIALAIIAIMMKGTPKEGIFSSAIEEAMKLGPTIYPMVFSAILPRALRAMGRYRAEHGIQLSSLWTLITSKAISDSVFNLMPLPLSLLGWILVILWALSPLGSQASTRLMYTTDLMTTTTKELRYLDNGPAGNIFTYVNLEVGMDGLMPLPMRDAYLASLMQSLSTKISPLDTWGNVKIPRLEALDASKADSEGWISTRGLNKVESYSSLFGLPIVGLQQFDKGTVEFSVETAYVALSCPTIESIMLNTTVPGFNVSCLDCITWENDVNPTLRLARMDAFLGPPLPGLNSSEQSDPIFYNPRTIQFNSTGVESPLLTQLTCSVTQRLVETYITCDNGTCAATKMRPSTTDHRGANYTSFDYWATSVLDLITGASQSTWGSTSSEIFLNDSNVIPVLTSLTSGNMSQQYVNLTSVPLDLLAERASMLLNSGIQTLMAPTGFAGELSTNLSIYGPAHIPAEGLLAFSASWGTGTNQSNGDVEPSSIDKLLAEGTPFICASTNASVTLATEVYEPDYVWVVVLLVSSTVLLLAGIAGLSFSFRTVAPDIFDPVMGLTYDNPYLPVPVGGSLEAGDRVKELGSLMVRLGNVNNFGVNKVALGMATKVQPLKEGNVYV